MRLRRLVLHAPDVLALLLVAFALAFAAGWIFDG